ncbi:MAG: glycosyltransferase [Victivallales bacterium]|nr:glycosyltransferase [Victivallales bacterium]
MLFSVITVSFNAAKVISETLDSILGQEFDDMEVIVVDGASTDGTVDIIRQYEAKFQGRLRWLSESDQGIYDAMNKGIALAKGDFVNFLNCGDSYMPNALARVAEQIHLHEDAQVVYGISRFFDDDGEVRLIRENHLRLRDRNICHQAIWYRRELFGKYGIYDLQYRFMADYDMNIRLCQAGVPFLPIDVVVVNYSMAGVSSDSNNSEEGQKETMTIFFKHGMVDKAHYKWFMGSFARRRIVDRVRTMARNCYYFFARLFR